jgi:cold shock CspA family protein
MATGTIVAFHKDKPICFLEDDQLKKRVLVLRLEELKIGDRVSYQLISSSSGLIGISVKKL